MAKKQSMLQSFGKLSGVKKLLIFVVVFAVIGGGVAAYKSFAAVPRYIAKTACYSFQVPEGSTISPVIANTGTNPPCQQKVERKAARDKSKYFYYSTGARGSTWPSASLDTATADVKAGYLQLNKDVQIPANWTLDSEKNSSIDGRETKILTFKNYPTDTIKPPADTPNVQTVMLTSLGHVVSMTEHSEAPYYPHLYDYTTFVFYNYDKVNENTNQAIKTWKWGDANFSTVPSISIKNQ